MKAAKSTNKKLFRKFLKIYEIYLNKHFLYRVIHDEYNKFDGFLGRSF